MTKSMYFVPDFMGNKITGVGTPSVGTDAATKAYADSLSAGNAGALGAKFVSVTSKGAVGNGSTDDTTNIKSAITQAGVGGTVYFPNTGADYMVSSPLKPLERQLWLGQVNPRYWIGTQSSLTGAFGSPQCSGIRATSGFSGAAVIYNDTGAGNGTGSSGTSTGSSSGVVISHMAIFGNAQDGSVDCIDLGQANGPERGWLVERSWLAYGSVGVAGFMWVVTLKDNMIVRNGWGIAPHRGTDGSARANDCMIQNNYVFFNKHHALEFGGSIESGLVTIMGNRFERSGTDQEAGGFPNVNSDSTACGIYITRATAINIIGNTTDSNAGPGLRIAAVADNAVNNITATGNIFKRDGSGDNTSSMTAGVAVKGAHSVNMIGNVITYGDPNDSGAGYVSPQYGVEIDSCQFTKWDGAVELQANNKTNAFRYLSTTRANDRIVVNDQRLAMMTIPATIPANIGSVPLQGTTYFNINAGAPTSWTGTAWTTATGGGGTSGGGTVQLTQSEYDALGTYDGATTYMVSGSGIRRIYAGTNKYSEWTIPFLGKRNSLLGYANAATITAATSGGASGDAFDTVSTAPAPVAATAADLTAAYSTIGATVALTAQTGCYMSWAHADPGAAGAYARIYARRLAAPPGANARVMRGYSGAGIAWECRWDWTLGRMLLTNFNGQTIAYIDGTVTALNTLNTIYRFEVWMSPTDGQVRAYLGDSTTMVGTPQSDTGNPDTTPWDSTRFGLMHSAAQTDSLQVAAPGFSTSDWLGAA